MPDEGELARLAEERNAAIRQYLSDRRSRLEIVATTRTPRGQVLDWVPVESLAPDGVVADPPDEGGLDLRFLDEPADGEEVRPARLVNFELQEEGVDRGPRGTVPVVRWDLDAITSTKTLQDFLSKHGRVARLRPDGFGDVAFPEDATVHKYAYSAQWVTAYGCEGNVNAWDPYLEWSNEFSLGQCALARGSGPNKQTIETGHQEYRDHYGDWVPHLFVFYTTNGYTKKGDKLGGYNQDVEGWVQYSSTIHPGALSTPLSTFGGTQYIMPLNGSFGRVTGGFAATASGSATTQRTCSARPGCATRPRRSPGTARSSTAATTPARPPPTWATATGPTRAGSAAPT